MSDFERIRAWIESHEDGFFDEGDRAELVRVVKSHSAEIQQYKAVYDAAKDCEFYFDRGCTCSTCEPAERLHNAIAAASDKQATDPKRDPLGEFDRRERSGSSVSDRLHSDWHSNKSGVDWGAADRQSGRFTRDNQDDLYLDGKRIGKLIGAPFNVLETLNAITVATKQRYCCDINATYPGKHRSGCPAESGR